ncbi:hypothetical protein HPMG_00971 [Helicobacter pullorum MIT 98-5489]|uniref:Uncharacterized protein n=1 Tax=Helicobacter pullorum MIT 98-5489 TaxID=537972 RepID=C5EZS0_9HELI|nr:hypothetical protein [Helicobacter pullorum]EEQ63514.1 hypothetical protein HPMG_00971 [Helicobacter pullorum MIT 98-5489]
MLGSIVTIEEKEGLLIEMIITTRVANPCGFYFGFFGEFMARARIFKVWD